MLAAARECIAEHGLGATSLTDVAERAGVGRTTAYRAFAGKQDLLDALIRDDFARFFAEIAPTLEPSGPIRDQFTGAVRFALGWYRDHEALQQILQTEPELLASTVINQSPDGTMLHLVSRGVAALLVQHPDAEQLAVEPAIAAEWMTRAMFSLFLVPGTLLGEDDSELAERFTDLVLSGVWLESNDQ